MALSFHDFILLPQFCVCVCARVWLSPSKKNFWKPENFADELCGLKECWFNPWKGFNSLQNVAWLYFRIQWTLWVGLEGRTSNLLHLLSFCFYLLMYWLRSYLWPVHHFDTIIHILISWKFFFFEKGEWMGLFLCDLIFNFSPKFFLIYF